MILVSAPIQIGPFNLGLGLRGWVLVQGLDNDFHSKTAHNCFVALYTYTNGLLYFTP